jgi:hypothetical protein
MSAPSLGTASAPLTPSASFRVDGQLALVAGSRVKVDGGWTAQ